MAFFDELGKKITKTSQGAIQKTKDMTEIAKLNSSVSEEQRKINQVYMQIGKAYYEAHATDTGDEFAYLFESIAESTEKINECESRIQQIKGVTLCPNCGGENKPGASFCCSCGAKIITANPDVSEVQKPDETVCTDCGSPLKPGALFCTNCGKRVDSCSSGDNAFTDTSTERSSGENTSTNTSTESSSGENASTDTFTESSSGGNAFTNTFTESSNNDATSSESSVNGDTYGGFIDPHR